MTPHTPIRRDVLNVALSRPARFRFAFVALVSVVLCVPQPSRADNLLWIGAPSIFNSWNDQNNWMNITPGGTATIPGSADTATFNTNAITSGGAALNLLIASTAALSIASSSVTVNGGSITNQHLLTFAALGNYDQLAISGNVTLVGGGELLLVDANSHIDAPSGSGILTNVDNLIHGSGTISIPLINRNIVRADNGLLMIQASLDNSAATARVEVKSSAELNLTSLAGLLVVEPGGIVRGILSDATNPGTLTVSAQNSITLANTLTNQGKITFAGLGNYDQLAINGNVMLAGGGELLLVDGNSHIDAPSGDGTLTNVDNLIHGSGTISIPLINRNIVRADNGLLMIQASLDNSAATARVEVKSSAELNLTSLAGLLVVEPGGIVRGILSDAMSPGTLTVSAQNSITLANTLTNQGKITFAGLGNYDQLAISGNVTLVGGGELLLVDANSHIDAPSGSGILTNVDNLIHGSGTISIPLINRNIVRADNGLLMIQASLDNSAATARVEVKSSAELNLTSLAGLLVVEPGGIVRGILSDATNPGTLTVSAQNSITLANTLTNQGKITFAGLGNYDQLGISGNVMLAGGGELFLVDANSHIDAPSGSGTLINADNVIHGGNSASISVPITNQATIRADNGALNIQAAIDNTVGTLQVQTAGLGAGESSLLHFGSNATLGGTLDVTFLNGFLPRAGDVLKPIQIDGTVSGDFSQITFRGIGPGFQVQAQFVGGYYQLTVLIDATPAPLIISPLSATAVLNQPFIYQIISSPHAIIYGASPLPTGLSVNPSTGIISGVPTQAGTSQVTLSATANGTGTAALTLIIQPPPSSGPVITSSMGSTGRTGQPFTFQVTTSGGSSTTSLAAAGLPPGLTADLVTGLISGTPTMDGSFRVTLTVTDGPAITTGTLQLTFTSDPEFPVIISSQSAALTPGQSFLYTIIAPGSIDPGDPTVFGLIGNLPPNLTFDAQTGTISGTFIGPFRHSGGAPNKVDLSGGIVTNVQLFASNSHGTSILPLIFFLAPTGIVNISTRLAVGTSDDVLIAGFIITGNAPKKVIVRALGPSLAVTGALQDTTLELHDGAPVLASNDDWRETQESQIIATTITPADDRESAIVAYLNPGNYTAIVRGKNNSAGVAIVEVYDLGTASLDGSSHAQLAQISTRGTVLTGDNVMIGGFILHGQATRVIVRAIGPSLTQSGVPNALGDPTLELHDGTGTLIFSNDNWRSTQEQEIILTGVPPTNDLESAVVATLAPGNYTAIVRGKNETTGVALVEVYGLQ